MRKHGGYPKSHSMCACMPRFPPQHPPPVHILRRSETAVGGRVPHAPPSWPRPEAHISLGPSLRPLTYRRSPAACNVVPEWAEGRCSNVTEQTSAEVLTAPPEGP
jgi:hypothetical protein